MSEQPTRALVAEAEGARLWRLGGAGSAPGGVVLLPGIEGDSRTFCRQARLSTRVPLWAADLPATGRLATDAAVLRRLLPPGPLLLVGCSYGGLVGLHLASEPSDGGRALVGVGALPHPRHRPMLLPWAARGLQMLPDATVRRRYRRRITRALEEEGVGLESQAAHLQALPAPEAHRKRLDAVCAWRGGPQPRGDLWWLRGQVDREAPWTLADARRALPTADVETIPGGHRPWLTHPGPLGDLIEQVWRNVARPR